MDNLASLIPIALLVVAFLFLVVRPARARRREFLALQNQLEIGQRVMLASGIFGELVTIGDETVDLLIAPETVVVVNRHAVSRVIGPETPHKTEMDD